VGDDFVEKLTNLRRLFSDTSTDSELRTYFYTDTDVSTIRDLTSCVQITENR